MDSCLIQGIYHAVLNWDKLGNLFNNPCLMHACKLLQQFRQTISSYSTCIIQVECLGGGAYI